MINTLSLRNGIVLAMALIYWGGVMINARRLRRHIGRSPNTRPRGVKEKLLWAGWSIVISGWIAQPIIMQRYSSGLFHPNALLLQPAGIIAGLLIAITGYAGTLWCYASMGDSWRIGINKEEKTALIKSGPYRFVRHPIYMFQTIILLGMIFLLPTPFSLLIFLLQFVCAVVKAKDEEAYLLSVHGPVYHSYISETGMLLPHIKRQ